MAWGGGTCLCVWFPRTRDGDGERYLTANDDSRSVADGCVDDDRMIVVVAVVLIVVARYVTTDSEKIVELFFQGRYDRHRVGALFKR